MAQRASLLAGPFMGPRAHEVSARLLQGHRCVVQCPRTKSPITVSMHTFPIIAAVRCALSSREGEEPGATPGRAGDRAGNGREAGISRALPLETILRDGDRMALAGIVPNEDRAWFEPAAARQARAARQTLQQAQAFTIKTAKGLFLQAAGQHSPQQVLA